MGQICGCKREGDDSKETNLACKIPNNNNNNNRECNNNDQLFETKFQAKLSSIGELYSSTLEDIIPSSIKAIREDIPFNNSFREVDNDNIHYKEEVKLKNGIIYKGGWNDSIKMEGKGIMILVNDQVLLEGNWKEGNFVYGRIYFKDGSYYEGEILGRLLNGQGKFINSNKEQYEGSFVNGFKEGQGCCHFEDGAIYIGEFKQDYLNGNGIMNWPNGTSYKGNFMNNVIEGNGEMTWDNGCKYNGSFINNWPDGEGAFAWPNGVVYIGQYQRGKKEGKGEYQLNKISIKGTWSNGVLRGKALIVYDNKEYSTIWRNGKVIEIKEPNNQGQEIEYFNSIPIQNEEYEPKKLSHIRILDESRYYDYKPYQPIQKSFESYFNTSKQ